MEGTMKENGHMGGPFLGSWDTVLACGERQEADVPFTSAVIILKELGAA
jgi:hypothetical protein